MPPSSWPPTKIGEFTWEVNERSRGGEEVLSCTKHDGFVPSLEYFDRKVFSSDTSNYKLIEEGQFAYATIHLDEGSIDYLRDRQNGIISPMYTVFDVDPSIADRGFLLEFLQSELMLRRYSAIGQGSINRRRSITYDTLAGETINLPPLDEQIEIAEILSSVDEAIQSTRAVIEQTRRVKEGLLQDLLTKGIDHRRFKDSVLGRIPSSWRISTPGDLAEFSSGHGFRPSDWGTEGLPIIRIQNVNGSTSFNYYDGDVKNKWLVPPGQLLFAWAGSAGASFGPCIWPGPQGVLNQHIYKINPRDGVSKSWLFAVMQSITSRIESRAHGFKSTLLHVHKADITDQPIPVPPISEQEEIANRLEHLEHSILLGEQQRSSKREVKSGLLQDLLTGKVRVKV